MPPGKCVGDCHECREENAGKTGSPKCSTTSRCFKRKWRAALKPGERLPRYEDVMLGSLGRLADHIALLKDDGDARIVAQRALRAEMARRGALGHSLVRAARRIAPPRWRKPRRARCRTAGRTWPPRIACATAWSGPTTCWRCRRHRAGARTLVGAYVNERGAQYNLLDAIFSSTDDGVVSLAALRDAAGRPFDFQIVHHQQGCVAAAEGYAAPICYGAGSARADTLLASPEVMDCLLGHLRAAAASSSRSRATDAIFGSVPPPSATWSR